MHRLAIWLFASAASAAFRLPISSSPVVASMSSPPLSDSPDVAGNAERVLYGPGLSIQERLGPVTGALRLDKIVQVHHTKRRLDIPWFFKDEAGNEKQTIVVHPLNKRRHRGVDLFYMKSFLKKRVVKYVSGTPILVASGDEKPPYLAITWGSRPRAFYSAVIHCKKKTTNSSTRHLPPAFRSALSSHGGRRRRSSTGSEITTTPSMTVLDIP